MIAVKFFSMDELITQSNITPSDYKTLYPLFTFDVSKQKEELKSVVEVCDSAHNEKLFSLKKTSNNTLWNYHFSIINIIVIIRLKLLKTDSWQFYILQAKIASSTTGGGTREECHKGRSTGKLVKARSLSCEHWTWCGYPIICQPFNPHLMFFIFPLLTDFAREMWRVYGQSLQYRELYQ